MVKRTVFESKSPNRDYPEVWDILADELVTKKAEVCLVDVRQPDEFVGELGHIPGAQSLPLNMLPERLEQLPHDQIIVFVCRSGGRSARATAFAQQNGMENVYNLQGGMIHWNELQFEIER